MNNAFRQGNRRAATPYLAAYMETHQLLVDGWDHSDLLLSEMEHACEQFGEMEC